MSNARANGARKAARMIIAAVVVLAVAAISLSAMSIKPSSSPSGDMANDHQHRPISCLDIESAELVDCDAALADIGQAGRPATNAKPVINRYEED